MSRCLRLLVGILGLLLLFTQVPACGDDDSGSSTAAEACEHYCSCSFASQIPNCQSTCVSGMNMANDPASCANCTASASCSQIEANHCENACAY